MAPKSGWLGQKLWKLNRPTSRRRAPSAIRRKTRPFLICCCFFAFGSTWQIRPNFYYATASRIIRAGNLAVSLFLSGLLSGVRFLNIQPSVVYSAPEARLRTREVASAASQIENLVASLICSPVRQSGYASADGIQVENPSPNTPNLPCFKLLLQAILKSREKIQSSLSLNEINTRQELREPL